MLKFPFLRKKSLEFAFLSFRSKCSFLNGQKKLKLRLSNFERHRVHWNAVIFVIAGEKRLSALADCPFEILYILLEFFS